ncbi:hypothetical protein R6258_00670 [Halomonas sp. HP20-15]|uniref:hypothetical protein n=1 Tax=Halomonas sp. HP20-15 TaxID=3085901 RepID=UPI0029811221|nr:hypothetical protein [Halomonas sp. HP20-15]MDW5375418.1 hypothetical protein [Halomonas sp. HP20-15]
MAALVFFTSLFLLVALLSITAVSGLFSGARGDKTGKSGTKTGQATRKPRQKRQPRQAGGGAAKSRRAASSKTRKTGEPRRRIRLPSIPIPPGLSSCLPLGLLFALMVGAGQLALYGLQQSRQGAAEDSRLAAFDGALDYLGVAALALVVLGLIGAIAAYRRKP